MTTTSHIIPGAFCTVGPAAVSGHRCGQPAVVAFAATTGETFFECAAHAVNATTHDPRFVPVHRYGRTYVGRVIRVKRTGTIVAEITYDNGAKRVVNVDA